ncbi:DUF6993 domain-containing protein [Microbacterium sp. NPDC055903]
MRRRTEYSRLRVGGSALVVLASVMLVACSPQEPTPVETEIVASTPSPTPTESRGPALVPDGSAEENLPLFEAVTARVWATEQKASGRAYIDALVAAGFDKAAMQVTDDETTIGRAVESLQFSVRWGETQCLVGQIGPSTGDPVTAVLPQLAEGRCLVGNTRVIDW